MVEPTTAAAAALPPATPERKPPAQATLTALQVLSVLCVVLPLVAYVSVGTYRYQQLRDETEVRIDRALRIAQEHALRVFDTTESLLGRVQDLATAPMEALAQSEPALHGQLRAMAQDKPQLQGIWIFGADGRPRIASRFSPPPNVNVSDRAYFRWHQEGRGGVHVSQPFVSRTTGDTILDVSVTRREPDGSFGGLISVSLLAEYFNKFHGDLVADEPGLAVTMFREDGAVFSRWPVLPGAPATMSASSPVLRSVQEGKAAASLVGVSSLDGRQRLLAYQKVGSYPVYIGTGMDLTEIRNRWLEEMAWLAAFGIPPMLGLYLTARLALRRSRDSLAATVRLEEETEARRRVEEALLQAQKLEALGRLTGGVAHDFNNALMVISNNLVLLRMKHPEAAGKYVESISRAVGSATKLTRQLLAFSRRQALVPEHVLLQQRLPTLRELVGPVLGTRLQLAITVDPSTRPIRVDAAEFELALLNLAINARDVLGQDGRFEIRARNARPDELPPLLQGPMVLVEACDNGPGIPPDLLDRVFEPFFTTKPVGEGTGLGLSQVYGLCQRAGGLATIDSRVGVGTTVRMFFPPDERPPVPDATAPSLRQHFGLHVLLVEDNTEVAGALAPVLESMGCTVTHFERAVPARDWLASQAQLPDVVLTDVVMPGELDGMALAQQVRAGWPKLHVIVMTGYAEQIDAIARLGFEILPKPCTPEMLAQALGRTVAA